MSRYVKGTVPLCQGDGSFDITDCQQDIQSPTRKAPANYLFIRFTRQFVQFLFFIRYNNCLPKGLEFDIQELILLNTEIFYILFIVKCQGQIQINLFFNLTESMIIGYTSEQNQELSLGFDTNGLI
jgi:hypothetical protein